MGFRLPLRATYFPGFTLASLVYYLLAATLLLAENWPAAGLWVFGFSLTTSWFPGPYGQAASWSAAYCRLNTNDASAGGRLWVFGLSLTTAYIPGNTNGYLASLLIAYGNLPNC